MTGKHYRPMTVSDIVSAARGLELQERTADELYELIHHYEQKDEFAAKVIVEAAHRELDKRWERGFDDV